MRWTHYTNEGSYCMCALCIQHALKLITFSALFISLWFPNSRHVALHFMDIKITSQGQKSVMYIYV